MDSPSPVKGAVPSSKPRAPTMTPTSWFAAVRDAAVDHGCGIARLSRKGRSLEDIFLEETLDASGVPQ
ncbi:MAG: hypothetical protein R2710_02320 [Acidimicrobiales bacterium]